ncbi:alpha/beta hydrolase family protein [Eudoraea chungangensis]|uniref:alpha/beta hydrolase family protein n=1 Tax=Eudoraea chungangensis TaxID=1481905 RepID=UPI0023EB8E5A|nr:alpha/beta hydrolase [Eudoraea chungangensis]
MNKLIYITVLILWGVNTFSQGKEELLDFDFNGVKLAGVLNLPNVNDAKGIVLIIHGDGKTNAIAGKWYSDVRKAILKAGYATYMWDKMGCGNSGGGYKNGRLVNNEAKEVIAAIENLKERKVKGFKKIGLWGISRAGWINPIVIDQYKKIDFWISVSGVDDDETFKYLLEQNLRIEGHNPEEIDLLVNEWHEGLLLSRNGASYEDYINASQSLQKNKFWNRITNGEMSSESYYNYQKILQETTLDKETRLPLYVENFELILSKINIPVLALFGETDMTVNWKKTKMLYENTMAMHTNLTIKTFPNCNHNMWQAISGGIYESEASNWEYIRCDGFLNSLTDWLNQLN